MMLIPFLNLRRLNKSIESSLYEAFSRVMDSGIFIMGRELESFESEFATYCGVKHCVGVGNGLDALTLILQAYDIGPGDEVLVPANTFIATWLSVSRCGARPVPIEPRLDTFNIDPHKVYSAITPKTRAIIAVHLYGQPADMDALNQIALECGLIVIEDAAQAHGARYKGRSTGSLSNSAAASFYPGKNLGALGDGGAVLTDDDHHAELVKKLRNYGSKSKYLHEVIGSNTRLDEMQAAFLRVKLSVLDQWNASRASIASQYANLLAEIDIDLPIVAEDLKPVWHQFVIRTRERAKLQFHLEKMGISTLIHYPIPPYKQDCYRHIDEASFPISNQLSNEVLSLPISPDLSNDEVEYVASKIREFF